jgi:hypothetical protein
VAEGIFALLGVAVGALIAAGTTYWMERKREDRVVQAAARQACIDLYACAYSIPGPDPRALGSLAEIRSRLDNYREHEATFAVHLRILQYLEVSITLAELRLFSGEANDGSELGEHERCRRESLRQETIHAGDILLEVARRGPAHMAPQRLFRRVHQRLGRKQEQATIREIREKVQELIRLQTGS